MIELPSRITIGDKYGPAMEMTEQAEASDYFESCVQHSISHGHTREKAEQIERANLGYYAGYYDSETRVRVEKLFRCSHPVFGAIAVEGQPSAEFALGEGMAMAAK